MRLKKALWIPLLLGALAGASGFLWLPAPLSLVREELQRRHLGFDLEGKAEFRWATGRLRVREPRLSFEGAELAAADSLQIRIDLRPWRLRGSAAARVLVKGLRADLDAKRLEQLQLLKDPDSSGISLELELEDAEWAWTEADGRRFTAKEVNGRVVSQVNQNGQMIAHAAASLRLQQPLAASLDLRLRLGPEPESWVLSVDVDAPEIPALSTLGLASAGLDCKSAAIHGRLNLQPDLWRVDLTGSAEGLRHSELPLPISLQRFHLTGDARRALKVEVEARTPHGEVSANAFLAHNGSDPATAAWDAWSYDSQAELTGLSLDASFRTRLTSVLPEATQILDNLGLSGVASARLRVAGAWGLGADSLEVVAAVPLAGIGFRYQGFTDELSGETFAFPEPVALRTGNLLAVNSLLFFRTEGAPTEAETDPEETPGLPPKILASGSVQIQPETAWVDLDIEALRFPVGPLLGRRLAANPALAGLWDELGSPRGGRADAQVRLRSTDAKIQVFVDAHATKLRATPPMLGELMTADAVDFHFINGDLSIGGNFSAAGIHARAQTRSRWIGLTEQATEWTGTARGTGLPKLDPSAPWVSALGIAPELLEATWDGTADWNVGLRLSVDLQGQTLDEPSVTIGVDLNSTRLKLPSQKMEMSDLASRAGLAFGPGGFALVAEAGQGIWSEAATRFGVRLRGQDFNALAGSLSLSLADARLSDEQADRVLALLGAETWGERKRLEGRFSANLEIPVDNPLAARARMDLNPLVLETLPPRRAARHESALFELQGRILFSDGQMQAPDLALSGPEVDLRLRDCTGRIDETGLSLSGRVLSAMGMQIRPPLGLVAPQSLLDSLDRIGINGRIAPRNLLFTVDWPTGATPTVTAHGSMELSNFHLGGPPPVENGAGRLECETLTWRGPDNFSGHFRLDEGTATVAGVRVTGALADIELTQDRVVVTGFAADALAGRVATDWLDEQGTSRHGSFALGLAGRAEVRGEFRFDDFLLERMGEELGFRGPLAGRLSGEISLRSPDPSPVNYRGNIRLDIRDGVLGTVPVLAQIWRLLGIESPTFRSGRMRLTMLGEGRILVDELSLNHPLLEITGERMLTIDSYLGLKVTVRTFGFFGRLPVILDVLDWFVEQDVYGPAAAPQLRQRGLGKIFTGDPARIPFPLWVPPVTRPDWRRSPALTPSSETTPRP